jgi:hypothetical protein
MLMTAARRDEMLIIELMGRGLFCQFATPGSPYHSAAGVARPTELSGGRFPQPWRRSARRQLLDGQAGRRHGLGETRHQFGKQRAW